jgi:HSP20 family protein
MSENTLQTAAPHTAVPETTATRGALYTPRVDILEKEDALVLYADLPGVRPEDVDVRFENGELVVHGKCAPRHPEANYLRAEYGVGDYYRAFAVSEQIDAGKIEATLQNGVLTLTLPKAEAVKPRKIAVKGAEGPRTNREKGGKHDG